MTPHIAYSTTDVGMGEIHGRRVRDRTDGAPAATLLLFRTPTSAAAPGALLAERSTSTRAES